MGTVLRGIRCALVAAAVALLAAAPISAPLLHRPDDRCTEDAVNHDPTEHSVRANTRPARSAHCVICHWWLSTGRFDGSTLPSPPAVDIYIGLVAKVPSVQPQAVVISHRPARAPPARLITF
jgi:hypothetical protein